MTTLELAAPCCLTLAAARLDGRPALIGIALRHPPVQLEARPAPALGVSGARADAAYAAAAAFQRGRGLAGGAALELELAVPSHMGLGSSAVVGLAAARALAALHDQPADDGAALARAAGLAADDGLAAHAVGSGGLLAVGADGALLRRAALSHAEARDWVFVLVLPRVPPGAPDDLEATLRGDLWAAAAALGDEAERIAAGALWPAVAADDIGAFAHALARLQALAPAAPLGEAEAATLAVMRAEGALVCGRAPTGLSLYALIEGAEPSRRMRRALAARLGHGGGTVMATICDNDGARHRMR